MYLIITASPNKDGLTAACGSAAREGIEKAGGQAALVDLCEAKVEACRVCGNGWGGCSKESRCVIDDALPGIQDKIRASVGVILVTPVYWWQPSERMKYFMDRFRRCEAFGKSGSAAAGKPFHLIAAAGGSGNGTADCLTEMEMWCRHVGAVPADRIGITRYTREHALPVIKNAASRMVTGDIFLPKKN